MKRVLSLLLVIGLFIAVPVTAQVDPDFSTNTVRIEAKLTDKQTGNPVTGQRNVTVRIYHQGNNVPVFTETFNNVGFDLGRFQLVLGLTQPLGPNVYNAESIVTLQVDNGEEITAPLGEHAIPYAINALYAQEAFSIDWSNIQNIPSVGTLPGTLSANQVPDQFITSRMIQDGTIDAAKLTGNIQAGILSADSVTGNHILNGSITNIELATGNYTAITGVGPLSSLVVSGNVWLPALSVASADSNQVVLYNTLDSQIYSIDTSAWDKSVTDDVTTFIGLTDTPATTNGAEGYFLTVSGNRIEFTNPASLNLGNAVTLEGLAAAQFLRSDISATFNGEILSVGATSTLNVLGTLQLSTPNTLPDNNYVLTIENGVVSLIDTASWNKTATSNGPIAFKDLTDAPSDFTGKDGYYVSVDEANNLLTLVQAPATSTNALTLGGIASANFLRSDVSDNYTAGILTFDAGTELIVTSGATLNITGGFTALNGVFGGQISAPTASVTTLNVDRILSTVSHLPVAGGLRLGNDLIIGLVPTDNDTPSADLFVEGDLIVNGTISQQGSSIHFSNLSVSNNALLSLVTTGSVGIGTNAPDAKLAVTASSNAATDKALRIRNSDGTSLFTVQNDGNVGIGTDSPTASLAVSGNTAIQGALSATGPLTIGTLYGLDQAGTLTVNAIILTATDNIWSNGALQADMATVTTLNAQYLSAVTLTGPLNGNNASITSLNTLQVNTIENDDAAELTVNDSLNIINDLVVGPLAIATSGTASADAFVEGNLYVNGIIYGTNSNINGRFDNLIVSNNVQLSLTPTTSVGIGTNTPVSKLSVVASGNLSTDSVFGLWDTLNNSLLIVQNDGNVGIGTNTPGYLLAVNGTASINALETLSLTLATPGNTWANGMLTVSDTLTAVTVNAATVNTTALSATSVNASGIVAATLSAPAINGVTLLDVAGLANNTADTITLSDKLNTTDDVIIGPLSIVGTAGTTGADLFVEGNVYINGNLHQNGMNTNFDNLSVTNNAHLALNSSGSVGIGTDTPSAKLEVVASSNGAADTAVNVTDSLGNSLLYVQNNGQVGIGTSTLSSYTLDVNGNAFVATDLTVGNNLIVTNTLTAPAISGFALQGALDANGQTISNAAAVTTTLLDTATIQNGADVTVNINDNLNILQGLAVAGNTLIGGDATVGGALSITGAFNPSTIGAFTLTGALNGNNQTISGVNTLSAALVETDTVQSAGTLLTLNDNVQLNGTLTANGVGTHTIAGTLDPANVAAFTLAGDITGAGNSILGLSVLSAQTLQDDGDATLSVNDNLSITGTLTATGALSVPSIGAFTLTGALNGNGQTITGLSTLQVATLTDTDNTVDVQDNLTVDGNLHTTGNLTVIGGSTLSTLAVNSIGGFTLTGALNANGNNITNAGTVGLSTIEDTDTLVVVNDSLQVNGDLTLNGVNPTLTTAQISGFRLTGGINANNNNIVNLGTLSGNIFSTVTLNVSDIQDIGDATVRVNDGLNVVGTLTVAGTGTHTVAGVLDPNDVAAFRLTGAIDANANNVTNIGTISGTTASFTTVSGTTVTGGTGTHVFGGTLDPNNVAGFTLTGAIAAGGQDITGVNNLTGAIVSATTHLAADTIQANGAGTLVTVNDNLTVAGTLQANGTGTHTIAGVLDPNDVAAFRLTGDINANSQAITNVRTLTATTINASVYQVGGVNQSQYFIDSAGTAGQVWKSDGAGRGVWGTDNTLTEAQVENFVANGVTAGAIPFSNGASFLTSGLTYDGSQQFNVTGRMNFNNSTNTAHTINLVNDKAIHIRGEQVSVAPPNYYGGHIYFGNYTTPLNPDFENTYIGNIGHQILRIFAKKGIRIHTADTGDLRLETMGTGSIELNSGQGGVNPITLRGSQINLNGNVTTTDGSPFAFISNSKQYAMILTNEYDGGDDDNTGVLALRLKGKNTHSGNEYISFYEDNGNSVVGAISGQYDSRQSATGIKLESLGADYAEYLPRLNRNEKLEAADIVGVFSGKITRNTSGAHRVMVISTAPIVLGNSKGKNNDGAEAVAFVGQVPVKVNGAVNAGDYIIPSGKNDGTGIAVSPATITAEQSGNIVGQAWESAQGRGVNIVNVALVPYSQPTATLQTLEKENNTLKAENAELKQMLSELRQDMNSFRKELDQLKASH